jgi:hypothetical protein
MMTGASLSPASVDAIIMKTIAQCDADGDGRISSSDFLISMNEYPWDSFTVPVKKTSRQEYFSLQGKMGARNSSSVNLSGSATSAMQH